MKLLNKSIFYISVSFLFVISLWALVFYFNMLNEIKKSVDEGLENYKRQIIHKVLADSTIVTKDNFDEFFFTIVEITRLQALSAKDRYADTMLHMQDADDEELEPEPARMLTTVFEHKGRYYELRIINLMVEEDDLIGELFRQTIWLYLILVSGIIIINHFLLQRLWKPFYSFLDQLKNYRLGSSKKLPVIRTRTKEFTDLQHAVNILLQHSMESYEHQKQFIGNASHELQTPLAIVISKLELLIEKGNLDNEQAESIAGILSIAERLVRLNKSLLLLIKIENKQFLENQTVSLNKIIRKSISDLEEMADFKDIKITIEETNQLSCRMDLTLANIVILNLIRNAVFHNISGGVINICISEKRIKICNSGRNETLNSDKIFTRFYKPETGSSGTGLGLAIVKAICGFYGFHISYSFEDSLHCFELRIDND